MHCFELLCTVYIKKDINFSESFEKISKYINFSLVQSGYEELHLENSFKHYVASGFYSKEKVLNGVYKAGSTCNLTIRLLDEKMANSLSKSLRENIDNPNFLIINISKKKIKQFFISELYSATPVVVSKNSRFWTMQESGDLMQLKKQLQDNLEKKYRDFYGEKLKEGQDFIQLIEIKNRVPQNIKINKNNKKITFFGNKFKIIPNEDKVSQKLAFMALASGLGEKNSFCGGFCLARGMR